MTEMGCAYGDRREQALVDYVYDELPRADRTAFAAHLHACAQCRAELEDLQGVRSALQKWAPPEPQFKTLGVQPASAPSQAAPELARASWWREMPVWAQVAAAMLVFGVSAGIANLDVRFADGGVSIHTGWLKAAPPSAASTAPSVSHADLVSLEQRLRSEFDAASLQAASTPAAAQLDEEMLMRRIRGLVQQSEVRQQREVALHVGQLASDVNFARQQDINWVTKNLAQLKNRTQVTQDKVDKVDYFVHQASFNR